MQAEREVATPTGPRKVLDVVADRFRIAGRREGARDRGDRGGAEARQRARQRVCAAATTASADLWRFSTGLHCPESDMRYADPQPAMFSLQLAP